MKKKYLSLIIIISVAVYFLAFYNIRKYKADYDYYDYYSNQDGFDAVDKEHTWIVDPGFEGGNKVTEEISYMYDSSTDSYTDELTYTEHSYCGKCGFDYTLADLKGGADYSFLEHQKTGCTHVGRVTGYYYITVNWPAQ